MKARISLLVLTLATLGSARPARAWDEMGHKVVARIAWDRLTPRARERAVALLMAAPADAGLRQLLPDDGRPLEERQRDLFVNAAYWADQIRTRTHPGNRFAHGQWHFQDLVWEQNIPGGPIMEHPERLTGGELLTQETRIAGTLGDAARPDSSRAVDLAWLLHLVGDAHQPLHNSARVTPQDTAGDRGGNLFLLGGLYPFSNLHAYWDALVGYAVPWAPGDRSESDYVGSVAARIESRHPASALQGRLRPGEFNEWAREGLRAAERSYPVWLVRGQRAPLRYREYAWSYGEERVALAGYRLADILNRTLM
jgi:hypothetical protein